MGGPIGDKGLMGKTGLTGSIGDSGVLGETGAPGHKGPKGMQGPRGSLGPRGVQGPPGLSVSGEQAQFQSDMDTIRSDELEAYEGNDVDAFYLGDIIRALGCNVTNAKVVELGGTEELGAKRIAFADFEAILTAVKADTSSTG